MSPSFYDFLTTKRDPESCFVLVKGVGACLLGLTCFTWEVMSRALRTADGPWRGSLAAHLHLCLLVPPCPSRAPGYALRAGGPRVQRRSCCYRSTGPTCRWSRGGTDCRLRLRFGCQTHLPGVSKLPWRTLV